MIWRCAAAFAALVCVSAAQAATLDEIAAAMGTAKLTTLQVSGTGMSTIVGQQVQASGDYPDAKVPRYARVEDYGAGAISLNYALLQDGTMRSAGGLAFGVENPRASGMSGDRAWTVTPQGATAAPQAMGGLTHELWTSPHGIVKAALADKAMVAGSSFEVSRPGRFKARATVNARNLVEKVESWVGNPVLGDMAIVTTYSDYRDFGGILVPTRMVQTTDGHPSMELALTTVQPNAGGVQVPAQIAAPAPPQVTMQKAAEGVWFVAGGSHNSVAIEQADGVIVVEGPLGDARAVAVIEAVRKQIPNKPIRAVIATHHHFDHSGGLRAFAAEGIAIATTEAAKNYFTRAYAAPRTIAPDRLARASRQVVFEVVSEGTIFSDATRPVEVFEQKGNEHVEGMLIVYLPREKILIEADAYSPRQPLTRTPDRINPFAANLWQNVKRLNLDPQIVLPIHGRMAKVDDLKMEVGAK